MPKNGARNRNQNMTQAGLLQVAEATQRAADAAQAASAAATASSAAVAATSTAGGSSGSSSNRPQAQVDWSKLVNKPAVFDFPNQEQDQQHWQLSQYLICVDEGFSKELTQIWGGPSWWAWFWQLARLLKTELLLLVIIRHLHLRPSRSSVS